MGPKEIGAIVSAYTGVVCGDFHEFHKYAEKLLGHSIWTHEFGDRDVFEEIKRKAKPDFIRLHVWCGGREALKGRGEGE